MKRWILSLLSALFFITPSYGDALTVGALLKTCEDPAQEQQSFCYGFIISATNAGQFYRNLVDTQDSFVDICFPSTISNKEVVDLFVVWAKKNKKLHDMAAFIGATTSFSTKYSCTDTTDKKSVEKK